MIVGRKRELRAVDELLAAARAGAGVVLLLRGEPGVGKSTLLRYAQEQATKMLVLSVRGIESDAELAYAGLHELLQPVLDRLELLAPARADALLAVLAAGPAATPDRFAVAAATLDLLALAASEQPVLVLVDDLPWLDGASGDALRTALRRLGRRPIAALLAARDEPTALDGAGFPELALAGLTARAARELAPGLAPEVLTRLVAETNGNPLALEEASAMLSPAQAAGSAPLPEPLPAGAGIARAFERRLEKLPLATRHALVVAAASQRDEVDILWPALTRLGLDEATLAPAEEQGVLTLEPGRIAWRHPLLRAAAYHLAPAPERRRAHRVLAEASPQAALAERAWHLAAAAARPDEGVARELERAAHDARHRGAVEAAALAFSRAAELSPEREARARRLVEAADDLRLAGRFDRARSLLDEALRISREPTQKADAGLLRGVIEMSTGNTARAVELLLTETDRVELVDPARGAKLLVEASLAVQMSGHTPSMLALSERALRLAERAGGLEQRRADDLVLNAHVLVGDAPAPAVLRNELRRRAANIGSREERIHVTAVILHMLVWIDEFDLAQRIFLGEADAARESGALGRLPFLDACLCELHFRAGRFAAARASGEAAVQLAEETEQLSVLSFGLVSLARVEAALGRIAECRAHATRALELARMLGIGSIEVYGLSVTGLLELGLGRAEEACAPLSRVASLVAELGLREPGVVQWRADFVEALALSGQVEAAWEALAVLEEEAARTERTWAVGAAARCRGMLTGEWFEREFERALAAHAAFAFEQARTRLRLGERLRRSRRAVEARSPLAEALQTFEELGAKPWANRARAELRAAGGRSGHAEASAADVLTPQERQIALLVAQGATNREAAGTLVLSPKTIEFHLGNVYRKLNVRSRAELTRLLATGSHPAAND